MITGESVPTLMRPLLVPSLVCKEIQSALRGIPSGDYHGPSKASLTGQEGRPPSPSLTLSLVGRTWKSETVKWVKRDSQVQVQKWSGMSQERRMVARPHETPAIG